MRVRISTILHDYTGGESEVEAGGSNLGEVLDELERRYPGLRFRVVDEQDRIRRHIAMYVGNDLAEGLDHPVGGSETVHIIGALSGG